MAEAGAPWQLGYEKVEQRCDYLLTSGLWSDCTFMVGSETNQAVVPAHKLVLAMASPVFEAMFYGGLSERNDPIVSIPDVQPEAFRALLQYIYTGNVNIGSFNMAWDLLYGAKKYMLPHLVIKCNNYICSVVDPRNACRGYELACFFDEKTIMYKCMQVISTNTKEVLIDSSFEDVEINTVITVCSLDHLTVDSELDLFHAVARYAEVEQRRQGQIHTVDDGPLSERLSELRLGPPTSGEKVLLPSVESSPQTSPAAELDSKTPTETKTSEPTADKETFKEKESTIRAALQKIRFLSLSAAQFAAGPARSGLLTEGESCAVLKNILSTDSPVPMPTGFSECRECRQPRSDSVDEGPIAKPRPKPAAESGADAATQVTSPDEIVRGLLSRERETLEGAARAARRLTCADADGTENITRLVVEGGVAPLVDALDHPRTGVQYDAAWAITNIACDGEHVRALVREGAVPALVGLLGRGGGGALAQQAAWALGNIAGGGDTARYIYTGNVNIGSFNMAWDLLYGAKKYMLPHLVIKCNNYICSVVDPRNACRGYELACFFDEKTIMYKCMQVISTNTKEVLIDSSFEDVEINTVITVCSLDHLTVDSELDLFHAVARYAEVEQRRQGQIHTVDDGPLSERLSELRLGPPTSGEKVLLPSVESSPQTSPAAELDSKTPTETKTSEPTADKETFKEKESTIRAALQKIRFLSLSAAQFAAGPARSGLLTEGESCAVLKNILSTDSPVPMPTGFSECRECRQPRSDSVDEGPIAKPRPKPAAESGADAATQVTSPDEIVRGLLSRERETLEGAARAARRLTCADADGTENITRLVVEGGVAPLVDALDHPRTGVQYDAAWAITNIACDGEHVRALVREGAVPALVGLLGRGGGGALAQQAAWALGNIAGGGDTARDAVVDAGAIPVLLAHMQPSTPSAPLGTYVRTYRMICQCSCWSPSAFEVVSPARAVPCLGSLLVLADEQVLAECCWTLWSLAHGAYHNLPLFTPSLAARLAALLPPGSAAPRVQAAALRALGTMLATDQLAELCLGAGCLDPIILILKCGNPSFLVEHAARTAGHILRGTPDHIQPALDKGILEALVPALTEGDDECKYLSASAITDLCACGSPSQLRELAASAALEPYCRVVGAGGRAAARVLVGLTTLLRTVEQNTKVALLLKLRHIALPQTLTAVLPDGDKANRKKAVKLLKTYFHDYH